MKNLLDQKNEIIAHISESMINSRKLKDQQWDALSLVMHLSDGQNSSSGYSYFGEKFNGWTVGGPEIFKLLIKLRELMSEEGGREWKKALIQITKPDLTINIEFEYDDESRWEPLIRSLGMKEYADSLHP